VHRDQHRVALAQHPRVLGERSRTERHVLDGCAGEELGRARRDLDDPVGAGIGEAAQGAIERLRRAATGCIAKHPGEFQINRRAPSSVLISEEC